MVNCNLWCFSLFAICLQSYVILIHPEKRALPSTPSCTQCIKSTKQGNTIISTLLYHTMKPKCNATYIAPCVQNDTQYFRCYTTKGIECYDPKAIGPITANIYIYTYKGETGTSVEKQFQLAQQRQGYLTHNETRDGNKVSACFDVCLAISKTAPSDRVSCGDLAWQRSYLQNNKYLYTPRKALFTGRASIQSGYDYWYTGTEANKIPGPFGFNITKGRARTDCSMDKCNPICISYEVPQKGTFYAKLGVGIDGSGSDPYGHVIIKTMATTYTSQPVPIYWEYEEEIEKLNALPVPPTAKNMFISLAQEVAHELLLTNCFVCGGTNMGDRWPWHAREANYTEIAHWYQNFTYIDSFNETWHMSTNLVGNICFSREETAARKKPMGFMRCLNEWKNNTWISYENLSSPNNFLATIPQLSFLADPENDATPWITPDGLYWVCGAYAYNILPAGWYGSCILAAIQPSFFLLPLQRRQLLGVPVYDRVGNIVKRAVDHEVGRGLKIGTWNDDEWPPERIIAYYDPATWAQDGSWGYRTPIYMLNRIIRLQAVVETITNRTAKALLKLAKESVLSRTYIMQNRLALDYLLAREGGVCGKFNLSNCCIQVDDSGKVIEQLTKEMVQLAHVPVQKWTGMLDNTGLFGGLFNNWKQALLMIAMAFTGLTMLPCLIPIVRSSIQSIVEAAVNKKEVQWMEALPLIKEYEEDNLGA